MNTQIIKFIKAGFVVGLIAAVIEMIISATMTTYLGKNVEATALVWGGATIGLIAMTLTTIISAVIAGYKQKI